MRFLLAKCQTVFLSDRLSLSEAPLGHQAIYSREIVRFPFTLTKYRACLRKYAIKKI